MSYWSDRRINEVNRNEGGSLTLTLIPKREQMKLLCKDFASLQDALFRNSIPKVLTECFYFTTHVTISNFTTKYNIHYRYIT